MGLWDQIQSAFDEALELRGEAREAYLRTVPEEASREVRQMLSAHENSEPLALEQRFLEPGFPVIPGYRVEELLGRGGMGDVYRGERENPPQTVALKVLGAGARTRDAQARFLQEQRILARLDDPGIVPLLDGGFTADGRPYLAMPYVRGEEILQHCERRALPLNARLRLFLEVARAVNHAHRNLVVHRDLKPSNILVTDEGSVRLLDFGIAKLLDPGLEAFTRVEWQVMTPEYAAPEQLRGEAITTATDVHGLGLLLYELLAGVRAFRGATTAELRRQIEDEEPAPPSAAAARPELRGDLDAIVLKALEKDPARRFGSVAEMANDIERHLQGRPVVSRPPSLKYRAGKFIRRNRPAAALAATVALLLLTLVALSIWNARRIALERDAARAEQRRAERVSSFLTNLLLMATPRQLPEGGLLTSADLIRRARLAVPDMGDEWPALLVELEGRNLERDGQLGRARERYETALRQLRAARQRDEKLIATLELDLANLRARVETPESSLPALRASLERIRQLFGDQHENTALALQSLAAALPAGPEQDRIADQALATRRRLEPQPALGTANGLAALAHIHFDSRRFPQASTAAREAREIYQRALPAGHPSIIDMLVLEADSASGQRDYETAAGLHREAIHLQEQTLGRETVPVAVIRANHATALALSGHRDQAIEAGAEAYRVFAKLLGPHHPYTPNAARHQAALLQLAGRHQEALDLLRTAESTQSGLSSRADHAELGLIRSRIAVLEQRLGRQEEGLANLRRTVATLRRLYPRGHAALADAEVELGFAVKDASEAENLFRRAIDWRESRGSAGPYRLAEAHCGLALAHARQHKRYSPACLATYESWGYADPVKLAALRSELR